MTDQEQQELLTDLFKAGTLAGRQAYTIDRLTEALQRIKQWCGAYPVEVFRPLRDEQIRYAGALLKERDIDIGALHAQWARHILDGLTRIVDDALKEEEPP